MKLFIITYDRDNASLVEMKEYEGPQRDDAEKFRFEKELALREYGPQYEVVLLESSDARTVKNTHRRYFKTVRDLATHSVADDLVPKAAKARRKG